MRPPDSSPDSEPAQLHVLQSCTRAAATGWQQACLDSVRRWADHHGHAHHWTDDALFDWLPGGLRDQTRAQPVVASDLARLAWMQAVLDEGVQQVVWLDADVLVIDPQAFQLPATGFAVGREVWVQAAGKGWRSHTKVHNACLLASQGNVQLPYYRHAAESIVRRHRPGHMVPQLVGPKLLTALHNLAPFDVIDTAGVFSPAVIGDLLAGSGPALAQFLRDSPAPVAAANLCASSVRGGTVTESDMRRVIEQLLTRGMPR